MLVYSSCPGSYDTLTSLAGRNVIARYVYIGTHPCARRELDPGVLGDIGEVAVARSLATRPVRLVHLELVLTLEAHSLDDRVRDVFH